MPEKSCDNYYQKVMDASFEITIDGNVFFRLVVKTTYVVLDTLTM